MISIGLPCDFCQSPTLPHCPSARCKWSRCPRCNSYGVPGADFVQWHAADYLNPYNLYDVKTAEPERTMLGYLAEDYGVRRSTDAEW